MDKMKFLERLQRLHEQIKDENTGRPHEAAEALHVSERRLYQMLNFLKDWGAEIKYSRRQRTYYYTSDFELRVQVSVEVIQNGTAREIYGGWYFAKNFFTARKLQ